MSQDIIAEITNFQQKKEDVLKNVTLLNNLSEKLTIAIQEEERKVHDNKIKDIIVSKKTQSDNELELLSLENKKMEGYLEILSRKQELELKYIEQLCEQKSRVEKVGEKYPHIELREFWSYDEYYNKHLQTTAEKSKKNKKQHTPPQQSRAESEDDYTQKLYQHYLEQHQQMQQMQQYIHHQKQCIQQQQQQQPQLSHNLKKKHNALAQEEVDYAVNDPTETTAKKKTNANVPPPPPNTNISQIESSNSSNDTTDITENPDVTPSFMSVAPLFPLSNQLKNPNNMKMLKKVDSSIEKQRPNARRESLHDQFTSILDTKFASLRNNIEPRDSDSDMSN